ncbi:MAG: butyryl-CoA:acetate CoA-transferase [Veillonellaceae bacterium]|nr:butyryl-CoA:acetate CoA-transferase [Veillonellaceae bacterium]
MSPQEEYQAKLRSPEQAVAVIKSGQWIDYGMALSEPRRLDAALARRKDELRDVKIRASLTVEPIQAVLADPKREAFTLCSWHFGGFERRLHEQDLCNYIPMVYRNEPSYYRNGLQVDVAMLKLTPMDQHGYFNFSLTNSATRAIIEAAKVVIVETDKNLPVALGGRDECVHISEVDYVVDGGDYPAFELPVGSFDEVDRRAAAFVVEEIVDGAVLQLGIGGMPNAVGTLIAESDVRDLGIHTEMLVDSYLTMYEAGRLTNRRKQIDRGKGVWAFCMGSRRLYEWIDHNPFLASYPVDYTNDPRVIAQNDNFVSINGCLEVDLYGQVSSESSGVRQITGSGGQLDFVSGAYDSRGGKSFICFRSTYTDPKTGRLASRILPTLPQGSTVTTPRTQAHYFVTEWGKAKLAGCSTWERAERLIGIAHPDFRDDLIRQAEAMKIWRRTQKI